MNHPCFDMIERRVSAGIRAGQAIDVYALVAELRTEIQNVDDPNLRKMIEEAIVLHAGCAVWEPPEKSSDES